MRRADAPEGDNQVRYILYHIVKIWTYEREGIALALTVGRKGYGKYRWNIVSHDVDFTHTDALGNPTVATVSLTLQEYLRK